MPHLVVRRRLFARFIEDREKHRHAPFQDDLVTALSAVGDRYPRFYVIADRAARAKRELASAPQAHNRAWNEPHFLTACKSFGASPGWQVHVGRERYGDGSFPRLGGRSWLAHRQL